MSARKFWGFTVLIMVVSLIFIFWPALAKAVGKKDTTDDNDSGDGFQLDTNKVLQHGSTGLEVEQLQQLLNKKQPSNPIEVDGIFGNLTEGKLYAVTGKYQIRLKDLQ